MGCITTHTTRIGGIRTATERATAPLSLRTSRIGGIQVEARRATPALGLQASRKGGTLRIAASLVCTVNHAMGYVRIEPQYVWLTESNLYSAIVSVESNVSWKAE